MRAEGFAALLVLLALPCCTVALDFSPGALQPSLDGGERDALPGVDAPVDATAAEVHVDAMGCDGRCACPAGWGDCDGVASNGCETSLLVSDLHCGSCGQACSGSMHCLDGACRGGGCRAGLVACGAQCADLLTDSRHCGACGASCGPGAMRCCNGACAARCP